MSETNLEGLIKIAGLLGSIYLLLQIFLPIIQNLFAQGIVGIILVGIFIWWLTQKN